MRLKKFKLTKLLGYCLVTCFLAFLTSCADDTPSISTAEETLSHAISIDKALSSLQAFTGDSSYISTRSIQRNHILTVKYKDTATRALKEDCDNLLYIVNFEDGNGFAVLSADDRISDEVIAIADSGTLTTADVQNALKDLDGERTVWDNYPTTGDGFFTVSDYPDEVFINPNTVSPYDTDEDDTFVGNYSEDKDDTEEDDAAETRSLPSSRSTDSDVRNEALVCNFCVSYAKDEVDSYITSTSSKTNKEVVNSSWTDTKSVTPILSQYVQWSQNSPFNDLSPKRRKYLLFGHQKKAPAGCFPLALSKIMTKFKYPSSYMYNDYQIDWDRLQMKRLSSEGSKSAAYLLRSIGSACSSLYFYGGTFTFPSKVTSYMRSIGYKNSHSYEYKFERVTSMIDNGCPLIIYALPGINVFSAHSWNIDGYKIKSRTVTTKVYQGSTLKSETSKTETCEMVHCDFGWSGSCNGYYVNKVFKLNSSENEYDNPTDKGKNVNYGRYLLKIITYDKPE